MSVRDNWTAREELTFYFAETINDDAWRTNVKTVSQLGAPGFEGDVWRVELEDQPHGVSQAALKVFKANFDMQAECLDPINKAKETGTPLHELIEPIARSFVSEATASIDNEHFLQPYAFGRMANRNAILMPVIDGDNLSDYIRANPDLSMDTRLKLCAELCRAIDAMHETGQLHNDIKPDNVMVDTSGREPTIRIIDMGFLCRIEDVKSIYGGKPRRVGTDGYMAPEIRLRGAANASTASDSWSVGCTLFYILTQLELVDGALDKKSEGAQNELYERLLEDMDQPLISVVRMERSGIEDQEIGEALAVLLTTHPKNRRWKKRPLIQMAELLEHRRSGGSGSATPTSDPPTDPPTEPKVEPARTRKATVRVPVPATSTVRIEEDFVKVIVRPVDGMKQIIVLMKDSEGYLRHQHVPQVDTSVSKLLRFTYIDGEVYVLPREGLPGLKFDGKDWTTPEKDANKKITKEGVRIEIDGVQIDLELR